VAIVLPGAALVAANLGDQRFGGVRAAPEEAGNEQAEKVVPARLGLGYPPRCRARRRGDAHGLIHRQASVRAVKVVLKARGKLLSVLVAGAQPGRNAAYQVRAVRSCACHPGPLGFEFREFKLKIKKATFPLILRDFLPGPDSQIEASFEFSLIVFKRGLRSGASHCLFLAISGPLFVAASGFLLL
jgi:hypothetical protein